jgi:hypothetical protein
MVEFEGFHAASHRGDRGGEGGADGEGATSHTCSRRSGLEGRLADKEKKRRGGGGQWARPDCDAEEVMGPRRKTKDDPL